MKAIDASSLAKFIFKEPGWEKVAEQLKLGTFSVDLIAKEAANAVWRRRERNEISSGEAESMLNALRALLGRAVELESEERYLEDALKIAFKRKITVYDGLYIALAKARGAALLTSDLRQAEAAKEEGVEVTEI